MRRKVYKDKAARYNKNKVVFILKRKEKKRIKNGTGNATFRTDLIDAVFNLTEEELTKGARYEIF